ncbi:MAG: NUDIX hydrolase [Pseudomonadota bacterium]
MRRIGEPWRAGKPYRDRPGVYGILAGADGMLLLVDQDGELQLPGGGIDPGESPLQALHREVREETGWRIADPVRIGAFQRFAWLPDYQFWARKVQAIYTARAIRDLRTELEPGHVAAWMPPMLAAQRLDIEGDRLVVRQAIRTGLI